MPMYGVLNDFTNNLVSKNRLARDQDAQFCKSEADSDTAFRCEHTSLILEDEPSESQC